MNLPDRFQFRVSHLPGFTHKVKKNAHGDYEVTWARGWLEQCTSLPMKTVSSSEFERWVDVGAFLIVDDTPKAEEKQALPDVIYFKTQYKDYIFVLTKQQPNLYGCHPKGECWHSGYAVYTTDYINKAFASGNWIRQKELTPEQKRANAEYREQVKALEASIKINEQDIEHKLRLIDNYNERIQTLKSKIVSDPSETIVEEV